MITAVTLGHLVAGFALGTRFRVVALAASLLVSLVTVTLSSLAAGLGLAWSVGAVIAALSALEIGFLAGAALRDRLTGPLPHPAPVAVHAVR